MVKIIKKDGTLEDFDNRKIVKAITKSANRVMYSFKESDYNAICNIIKSEIDKKELKEIYSSFV